MEDADPTLYAHGDRLRPLVEATGSAQTLNIYGPGGQIIAQVARDGLGGSQKAPHLLADHLGSTRAALDADGNVVARFEYGPHGETATSGTGTAAELPYRYTGHPYDEAQGLYETPARTYDPTVGRFLSVDAARHSTSPYNYAGNNPINKIDPDGQKPLYFFLYSGYGVEIVDYIRTVSLRESVLQLRSAARASGLPMVTGQLEGATKISVPAWHEMEHVTVFLHGVLGLVGVVDPKIGVPVIQTPEQFAAFVHERLRANVDIPTDGLKSILIASCKAACRSGPPLDRSGRARTTFADRFAVAAKKLFPALERVIATPYDITFSTEELGRNTVTLDVWENRVAGNEHSVRILVDAARFFSGDLPRPLLAPPSPGTVRSVWSQTPHHNPASGTGRYTRFEDPAIKRDFFKYHNFPEPVFREIYVRGPAPIVEAPVD